MCKPLMFSDERRIKKKREVTWRTWWYGGDEYDGSSDSANGESENQRGDPSLPCRCSADEIFWQTTMMDAGFLFCSLPSRSRTTMYVGVFYSSHSHLLSLVNVHSLQYCPSLPFLAPNLFHYPFVFFMHTLSVYFR